MKLTQFRKLIREEVRRVLEEAQLDPQNQKLKDKYIEAYVVLTIDPYAFDDSDDWESAPSIEDIEAHAKKYGYENTLKTIDKMQDVRALRSKYAVGSQDDPLKAKTPGTWVDNLSMRDPLMYLTKNGKMSKLDVDRLKLRIKKNLNLEEVRRALSENSPTPADIVDIIRSNYSKYKNFGLRSLPKEIPITIGGTMRDSNLWTWSGEDTGVSLGGASTIGIFSAKENDIKKYLKIMDEYGEQGSNVILVGGKLARRGQDDGELIIKDAVALKVWTKK